MKIEIRSFFNWHEATKERALIFCNEMIKSGMPNIDPDKRIEIINKNHLRGITYEELKKQVKENEEENWRFNFKGSKRNAR